MRSICGARFGAAAGVLNFEPEMVFYLSGVDALASDVLGRLALTPEGLKARDRRVIGGVLSRIGFRW